MLKKRIVAAAFVSLLMIIVIVRFGADVTVSSFDNGLAHETLDAGSEVVKMSQAPTEPPATKETTVYTTQDITKRTLAVENDAGYDVTPKVRLDDIMEKVVPKGVLRRQFPVCTAAECADAAGECWCYNGKSPADLPAKKLPQIVFLTFDDYVVAERMEVFRKMKLLHGERRNPNGCPMSATFFINDEKKPLNNYTMVRQLYDLGHEIATHSLTHSTNYDKGSKEFWETEMVTQRENIHKLSGIPLEDLPGLRAPYLDMGGDNQFQMMQENGFGWDSSVITPGFDDGPAWPFKVGQRFDDCWNENCPRFQRFSGFWEVPVGRWIGPDSMGGGCDMADMCDDELPVDEKDTKSFLWKNFLNVYRGSRRPFPLCVHAFTFTGEESPLGPMYLRVFSEFLDQISRLEDVYLISVSQMLDWIKDPQTLNKVKDFEPWKRTCKLHV